jgi:AbrB family looped-hinge helix DNA binding protein
MSTATLSTKGQLVIPNRLRQALHLRAGDKVSFKVEGHRLVVERATTAAARLVDEHGHPVLVAPAGAPPMTSETVKAILTDSP